MWSTLDITFEDPQREQKMKSQINTYGFCVVTNVLTETESNKMAYDMASTLSYVSSNMPKPFNLNDTGTYNTLREMLPTRGMIFQNFGLGQAQCCWDVRCNDKVIKCFADLYGTSDLLTSIDGFSFTVPPEMNNGKGYNKEPWYHFDQSTQRSNFECIQGWVTALDVTQGDATLVVMVGSQKYHNEYGNKFGYVKDDWVLVKDNVQFFKDKGCFEYRIVCPKGSLVLWDSRCLHYGSQPLLGRSNQNYRAIVYVCYTPRDWSTEKDRKKKVEYFQARGSHGYKRTTSHWPHRPKIFAEVPRVFDGILPPVLQLPDPIIDQKYMRLIGY